MPVELRSTTGALLYTAEVLDVLALTETAVAAGADLVRANLAGANLAGANLAGANLARADLADADLTGANLARVNLAGAYLAGADLARADLADADLAGARPPLLQITGSRGSITCLGPYITVGCRAGLLDWWLCQGERIAQRNNYSPADIAEYRLHFAHIQAWLMLPEVQARIDGVSRGRS